MMVLGTDVVRVDTEGIVVPLALGEAEGDALDLLQAAVGGYVDVVRLGNGIDMWCGDEAAFREPVNPTVSALCKSLGQQPVIWGAVVFASADDEGRTTALCAQQLKILADWFAAARAVAPGEGRLIRVAGQIDLVYAEVASRGVQL